MQSNHKSVVHSAYFEPGGGSKTRAVISSFLFPACVSLHPQSVVEGHSVCSAGESVRSLFDCVVIKYQSLFVLV
jgi:hypothetical protein